MAKNKPVLIYVGQGAHIGGVPARDLCKEDIAKYVLDIDVLIGSGLYEKPKRANKPAVVAVKSSTVKDKNSEVSS